MSTNQLYAMVLLILYVIIHKSMPSMDFSNIDYVISIGSTCVISWIIVFQLVK